MFKDIYNQASDMPISIIFMAIMLTCLGLIVLSSISTNQFDVIAITTFTKQLLFLIPALVGFLTILFIPKYMIHKYIYAAYSLMLMLILVPFLFETIAGTHRWINIGLPVGVQPSEFAKWIVVVALARYLSDHNLQMKKFMTILFPIFIALVPAIIVLQQPDLGTAIILLTPILPMLYWVGARPFHLFMLVAPVLSIATAFHTISFTVWAICMGSIIYMTRPRLIFGVVFYFGNIFLGLLSPFLWSSLRPYQQKRILTLFNPELDPLGAAYQTIQSKVAIGSGGFLGKGLGEGTQTHLKFLPVQESDFIVSVIGEELGFITIAVMLIIFANFILKIVKLAFLAKERFAGLVLIGIGTIFMAHVFVNTAMSTGMIPVKGLPLPFISAGGSFLVSCFIMIGLIMKMGDESIE
ncbi:MAG TPA: rod shape-determining protein RodA [Candidatus Marinimicrobia bacterium]|nr:rod shape-determining protein RodA [Candidatus Neomarinimicrobiota bacterium]HIM27657.1 rod shape-determining protein RodA [Candidatus Neomarinimicrobiota bacterium]